MKTRPTAAPPLAALSGSAGLVWSLGSLVFCYAAYRAFTLSMTCDEAWSASGFPQPSLFAYLTPAFIAGLNNHFLNSWLMNLSLTIFGKTDWAVRLPALCGGAIYITASCRLALTRTSSWRAPALTAMLLCNPYLLDFLSLGRGYALGLGFMALGLTGLLSSQERRRAWSLAWLALAALSNLSFLYAYLTALAIVWGEALFGKNRRAGLLGATAPSLLTLGLLAGVYARAMALAASNNEYWWGSPFGLVDGTLASLIRVTMYETKLPPGVFIAVARGLAVLLVLALASGCIAAAGRTGRAEAKRPFFSMATFLAICMTGIVTEHALFGTPYLVERGALFLYPPLCMFLVFWAEYVRERAPASWISLSALSVVLCLSVVNSALSVNLRYTSTWRGDTCARSFMTRVHEENYQRNFTRAPIRIASSAIHRHTLNYYIDRLNMEYVAEILPESRSMDADYVFINAIQARPLLQGGAFQEVAGCPAVDMVLLRRVHPGNGPPPGR